MEMRLSYNCLISTVGFPGLVRWGLVLKQTLIIHLFENTMSNGVIISFWYLKIGSLWYKGVIYLVWAEYHDDVIKWKHFPRYWPFVRRIHRSPVNSPHKGQWRGALMFTLICARINGWVNNREAGDLRPNRAHYGVIVMSYGYKAGKCVVCIIYIMFIEIKFS